MHRFIYCSILKIILLYIVFVYFLFHARYELSWMDISSGFLFLFCNFPTQVEWVKYQLLPERALWRRICLRITMKHKKKTTEPSMPSASWVSFFLTRWKATNAILNMNRSRAVHTFHFSSYLYLRIKDSPLNKGFETNNKITTDCDLFFQVQVSKNQ